MFCVFMCSCPPTSCPRPCDPQGQITAQVVPLVKHVAHSETAVVIFLEYRKTSNRSRVSSSLQDAGVLTRSLAPIEAGMVVTFELYELYFWLELYERKIK